MTIPEPHISEFHVRQIMNNIFSFIKVFVLCTVDLLGFCFQFTVSYMEPPPFTNSACLAKFAGLNSGFGWWSFPYNDLTSYYMLAIEGNHPPSRQDVFLLFLRMCV